MISLRELLTQIIEERQGMTAAAHQARSVGLVRKRGYGNWGPPGNDLVTRRTIKGHLKSIVPHRLGRKTKGMSGQPKPNMMLINKKGIPTKAKPPEIKFPLWRNRY